MPLSQPVQPPEEQRVTLRMPWDLWQRLRLNARANHRSINAELVVAIEKYLDVPFDYLEETDPPIDLVVSKRIEELPPSSSSSSSSEE